MSSTPRHRNRPEAKAINLEPTTQQVDREGADASGGEANTEKPKDIGMDDGLAAPGGVDPTDQVVPETAESVSPGAPNEAAPRGENDGSARPPGLTSTPAVQKGRKGFLPGRSGNPNGRPKGSKNKATQLSKDLLEEAAEAIVSALVDKAKDGDLRAIKMCLDRFHPQPRPTPDGFEMPRVTTIDDAQNALGEIAEALARGDTDTETANMLSKSVQFQVTNFILSGLIKKVTEIEKEVDEIL